MDPGYEHRCTVWLGAKGLSATQTLATTAPTTTFFDTFAPMPASHLLIAAPACAPSCCSTDEYIVLTSPDPGASWACSRSGTAALQWPLLCLATQPDFGFCFVLRLPTPTPPQPSLPVPPVQIRTYFRSARSSYQHVVAGGGFGHQSASGRRASKGGVPCCGHACVF